MGKGERWGYYWNSRFVGEEVLGLGEWGSQVCEWGVDCVDEGGNCGASLGVSVALVENVY